MALGVLQQGACAGGAETVGFKVGALAVAAGVFKGLGGVQVLEAQIAAGRRNGLVELVNAGLGLGSVRAVLGNGRDAHRDDVAVGVGRADALQELLVVGNEGVHTDRAVHIVRAQHHKDAASLHLGDGLRDRVAAGVRCKVYTGGGQRLGNLQSLLPDKLIQRDASVQKTDGMASQFGYTETYAVLSENKLTVASGAFLSSDMMERQSFSQLMSKFAENVKY